MRPKRSNDERFDGRVVRYPGISCWLWDGSQSKGYGHLYLEDGRKVAAHRYAYERFVGPIPKGRVLMHLCDIRCCVNPKHLMPGTPQQNTNHMVAKKRHTFGERRHNAVLTEEDVRYIRCSTEGTSELARRYGVTPSAISQTRSGKNWRYVRD